jgi:hypothetical protein
VCANEILLEEIRRGIIKKKITYKHWIKIKDIEKWKTLKDKELVEYRFLS